MKTILGLVVAALISTPATSQTLGGTLVAKPDTLAVGSMEGYWNLPLNGALGVAGGTLSFGVPQYRMIADLPPEPIVITPNGQVAGFFQGGLQPFPLTPGATFVFNVSGQWRWDPDTGKGHFGGFISTIGLPNPGGIPIYLIGTMRGSFQDQPPVTPLAPDPLGSFQGGWTLFFVSAPAPIPDPHPYPGPGGDEG